MIRTLILLLFFNLLSVFSFAGTDKRPNFVWLMSEDNSVHYNDLYFETGANTPTIRSLGEHGIVFNHAFSCAPVCSVARSTLSTGTYASRLAAQFPRKKQGVVLPKNIQPIFEVLHNAGYYTSFHKKHDFNFKANPKKWSSDKDWSGRKEGQPFFHKHQLNITHEGPLHKAELDNLGANGFVMPQHPDTTIFRKTHEAYLRHHMRMDQDIKRIVRRLEKEGVLEDTFIFYFGDHGGVLPGSKGYLFETGLHVPLVIRVPKNFQHLVTMENGSRFNGFVEFVDFAPTVLNLAGVEAPSGYDGRPFLGPGVDMEQAYLRNETIGFADRMDEKYDLVRSLRKGHIKYIRNYQPFNFNGLKNKYRYHMPAWKEWRELYISGKLNALQSRFFETKAVEELYDLNNDPYETVNLADNPKYAELLVFMRDYLSARLKKMPDMGFYPEYFLLNEAIQSPDKFAREHKEEIAQLIDISNLALKPFDEVSSDIEAALKSKNPWHRYWALITCSSFLEQAKMFVPIAKEIAKRDKTLVVRARAAEFLALIREQDPQKVMLELLKSSDNEMESVAVYRTRADSEEEAEGQDTEEDL